MHCMADTRWHYTKNGTQQSPVTEAELRQLAISGQLRPGDMVWCEGMAQWGPAANVRGLFPAGTLPPAMPAAPISYYAHAPGSSRPGDIGQDAGMRILLPVGRSGWAIAAGYLGLFSFVILPAPLALIISIIAMVDMKKHPEKHGMGRAIFGLIMGILGTILLLIVLGARMFGR
jgi:hypothetical protein